ncbi:unnamed protein product [Cuscuta campestris]|uniref:Histone-lysine N-methyltransferase n=1 Tax=Cuscuta campestris TaxID=132261 RepID=A0A484N3F6_9ASTE|nr:unnamed protein product [Cuscuta campestris]
MISQTLVGENVCGCNKKSSSTVIKLSPSTKSSEPFSGRDDKLSKSTGSVNASGTDVLSTAFDYVNIAQLSEHKYGKIRGSPKSDDAVERKCSEIVCMTPCECGQKGLLLHNEFKQPARNTRREAAKRVAFDIDNLSIMRRRRTSCRKQTRASVWGSLRDAIQAFGGVETLKSDKRKSRRAKRCQKSEKKGKNQAAQSLQKSMTKTRICLKIKFGQRSLMDILPLVENGEETYSSICYEPTKGSENIGDLFVDKLNRSSRLNGLNESSDNSFMLYDASATNACLASKSIVESPTEKYLASRHESPSQAAAVKPETPVDDMCSNPGTSPDSEVINLMTDAHISLNGLGNLRVLMSTQPSVAGGDVESICMLENCHTKENKNDKFNKTVDCSVKATIHSSEIMSTEQTLVRGDIKGNDSYHDQKDMSIVTTAENARRSVSSIELQPLSKMDDFQMSSAPVFEDSGEINHCRSLDTRSLVLQMPEKPHSSLEGLKILEIGKSNGVEESQSEVLKSPSTANSSKEKANKGKPAREYEAMKKNHGVQGLTELRNDPKTDGQTPSHCGQIASGNKIPGFLSNQIEECAAPVTPRNAWVQCDDCQKWRRITALLADQIEETNCKWICKDNNDKDFADCSIRQEKSNSAINAELEISDVSENEDASCSLSRSHPGKKSKVDQSPCWKLIKSNLFLHRTRKSQTIDEVMVCQCKPPSDGRMGCEDGCLNRMLNIECVQGTCPCGEQCSNQQFQKRNYTNLKWFKCGKKGYGLQLLEAVSEGRFLIEYVGEVLDMDAYEKRQSEYASKGHKHFYFMTLYGGEVIDACAKGNLGRFINHSCDPNCRTEKWIVNGEVCVGIFALRDIKKGEEVTFDYNYVRIFGAAAKKCVCGSSQCRGYIGSDTLNAEIVVQDDSEDEYPEPVVVFENIDIDDELNYVKSAACSFNHSELRNVDESPEKDIVINGQGSVHSQNTIGIKNGNPICTENFETNIHSAAVECLVTTEMSENLLDSSASSTRREETSSSLEGSRGMQSFDAKEDGLEGVNNLQTSLCYPVKSKTLSKQFKNIKSCCARVKAEASKPPPLVKTPQVSSLVKKAKPKNTKTSLAIYNGPKLPELKSKKLSDGSLNSRSEAVEEKLNELLDTEGGISKRKDASKSYLKLLLLTAASGDSGNSETIQSNRELSMILDALLKTKSRTVLVDIINKNGLQMLHNIMKRYRREFNKIPILRKLLKVLEYLALREILACEHIIGSPHRPGVESFRDSILSLTEHIDKQVHHIARSFRDRWIPRLPRKSCFMDRDEGWTTELHLHSMVGSTATTDACALDCSSLASSGLGVSNNMTRVRKRKTQCDPESKTNDDCQQDINDDDAPPGFSSPINNPREQFTSTWPVMGHCQHRYNPNILLSFGIPVNEVRQLGTPIIEPSEGWAVAPGTPFHPFPPLPTYPYRSKGIVPPAPSSEVPHQPARTPCDHKNLPQPFKNCFPDYPYQTMQSPTAGAGNLPPVAATRGHSRPSPAGSFKMGKRYIRQQRWSGSKFQPRRRGRNSWGYSGNHGMCNARFGGTPNEFRFRGQVDVGFKEGPWNLLPKY